MRSHGTITVNGETVNLDEEVGDLTIRDITKGMNEVAARMSRVASLWGEAETEKVEADAKYRNWAATYATSLADADGKMPAEHKVKAQIESAAEFLECKREIARTEGNVVKLKGLFLSLEQMGSQLQSRGARERAELDATGMHTPEEEPARSPAEARKDIRGLVGKKKPK